MKKNALSKKNNKGIFGWAGNMIDEMVGVFDSIDFPLVERTSTKDRYVVRINTSGLDSKNLSVKTFNRTLFVSGTAGKEYEKQFSLVEKLPNCAVVHGCTAIYKRKDNALAISFPIDLERGMSKEIKIKVI